LSKVLRIVANIKSDSLTETDAFYRDIFGLTLLMDQGWIQTWGADAKSPVQLSIATEGGSGTEVPDISIEVDDLHETLTRAKQKGIAIEYGPVVESWGVERFYIKDPFGKLINVMQHK